MITSFRKYSIVEEIQLLCSAIKTHGDYSSVRNALLEMNRLSSEFNCLLLKSDDEKLNIFNSTHSFLTIREQKFIDNCFIGYEKIENSPVLLKRITR